MSFRIKWHFVCFCSHLVQ